MQESSMTGNPVADIVAEKRKKVLKRIKELPADELQVLYVSLFEKEIIEEFDKLPKPRKKITDEELSAYMTKKRQENGFYK